MATILPCFENLNFPSCIWFEVGSKRNVLASILAGTLVRFLLTLYGEVNCWSVLCKAGLHIVQPLFNLIN